MFEVNRILLVSQNPAEEQSLFDWTLALAKRKQASIKCLRVLPTTSSSVSILLDDVSVTGLVNKQTQHALESMQAWSDHASEQGVELETQVEFGKLFYKTVQQVLKDHVDLVVKQTDEEIKNLAHHVFGSQDMHLLRKCPCPLLLHKQASPIILNKVMASIDVDIESETLKIDPLNQVILSVAQDVAQADNAFLHIAHAWQADAENLVRYWNSDLSDEDMLSFSEKVRQQHLSALEYEIRTVRDAMPALQVHAAKGDAKEVIPQLVANLGIDLLVMGTLGRVGLPGLVIGNTAESILEQVECSVLAIKPTDFVTPISV
ncbi:MAG: universal stress protein [Thiomicrospira sp.]|uniref:universal stress protein n=1 Tax=Thiomicrospira sp. TaxID=935 RepID=UPI0019FA87A3|nr:universal stress protein [Thiomicrospira sp.]MBE0493258.1 universal stress protein [Thiomicrospira sp.]